MRDSSRGSAMAVEETLRRRRAKQAAPAEVPLIRPLRGTFSSSKAGEKGKWGTGEKGKSGARSLLFPSPHAVGRRCPGGADEGLFLRETRCRCIRAICPAG